MFQNRLKFFLLGGVTFGILVVVALGLLFYFLAKEVPEVSVLKNYQHELASEVYSKDGIKIGEFTTERRYPVEFSRIPKYVIQAFLAAEDSKFYEHKGIDFAGIARAALSNILRAKFAQGGSTITQQVARTLLLTRKKELSRKVKEIILAFRMEKQLTKDEILALYLSEIYLGHGAYGIGAAAQNYFGKKIEDVTIAEAALLAGLPQRPNEWDPFRNPGIAKRRQSYVLKRMAEEKFITEAQAKEALNQTLKLYSLEDLNNNAAPFFIEYVRQYLMNKYGSENVLHEGYKVYTSVNYRYQKLAERVLEKGIRAVDKRLGWRGVKRNIAEAKERETFLSSVHESVLESATLARLLPPQIEVKSKKLSIDLSFLEEKNSPYFGVTPVKVGEIYEGMVVGVDDAKKIALVRIGATVAQLPLQSLDWIKVEEKPVKSISQVFKEGDVISVQVEKPDAQKSQAIVSLEQEPEIQGALLSYEIQTGEVLSMIGGRNFQQSKFNRALQAKRQVGSTFKPILYAAAMDKGFSPSSLVTDAPLVFKHEEGLDADSQGEDWRPKNYSGKYEGDIPLRLALIRSMNIPTVKLLNEVGLEYGINYARSLGISSALPHDLSIALGSWSSSLEEISRAYSVFPRLGKTLDLQYIKKVIDPVGKIMEEVVASDRAPASKKSDLAPLEADPTLKEQGLVITPQTAYVMTEMLKGVVREGTGRPAFIPGISVAGKTGTSNDHRDAWFVGFTPSVMTGIWIGYDKNKPLDPHETGGKAAAPIWAEYMSEVIKDFPKEDFQIPEEIVFAYIDRETGKPASSNNPKRVRVAFKVGTVPNKMADNIPRIGEPGGNRAMSNVPEGEGSQVVTPKEDDTTDLLREGYQD